jgi:Ni,Fe-hydrogenase III large subunit
MSDTVSIRNGEAVALSDVPRLGERQFRQRLISGVHAGERLGALFGHALSSERVALVGVLADDDAGTLSVCTTEVGQTYPALTPDCSQAHWFEREIAEQWGVRPKGHPWLKPIRFDSNGHPRPALHDNGNGGRPLVGVTDFFRIRGAEVHEVAVGPVHAGIIEPGHFRFLCHGEHVLHLEISLGYQHRGVERALVGGPHKRTVHYMETLAGDTSVAHATAYCEAVETLAGCQVPARAQVLRGVALELERLANHTGDLGALAGDVAYLPTAAYCGRIRGDFLNMTALLCGSRFGRGFVRPGGVRFDVDARRVGDLRERLEHAIVDVTEAVALLWETPSVQARFENTGVLSRDLCSALGLVGPVARACAIERDIRRDFATGIYRFAHVPVSTWHSGDVFARAYVRWLEIQRSLDFLRDQLDCLPDGPTRAALPPLPENQLVVSLVEGWRGEVCHVGITGEHGRFARYKIVDPSFRNWMGLAMAMRGQEISDFPLCNKSFNLSYCGHDL